MLVKVLNYIFVSLDSGENIILILLDLSAAFDMVDHGILIKCLEHWVGLKGNVLKWFTSDLTDRSFSVSFGNCVLSRLHLPCGTPSPTEAIRKDKRRSDDSEGRESRPGAF